MKEIKLFGLKLYQLRNAEHYQLHVPVLECIESQTESIAALDIPRTRYQQLVEREENLFNSFQKSPETEVLREIDHQRDLCLEEIKRTVRFALKSRDMSQKMAAKKLQFILDNFKKTDRKPYAENTALVTNLLQEFDKADEQAAIMHLRLNEVVEELRGHNIAFDVVYGKRAKAQKLLREEGRFIDLRIEVDKAFFELVKVINVLYQSNELTTKDPALAATLGAVIDEINGRIAQTKLVYTRRAGRLV